MRTTGYAGNTQRALRAALLASLWLAPSLATVVRPAMAGSTREPAMDRDRLRRQLKGGVVKTVDGHALSLDTLQGEVVVLNWAPCPPCRRELPRPTRSTGRGPWRARGGDLIDEEARNERRPRAAASLPPHHDGPDHWRGG
jgi:hypothetical protein